MDSQNSGEIVEYVDRYEWLSQNEMVLSDMWNAMCNYIRDTNVFVLDRCDYNKFCEFVADNSTHFDDQE